MTIYTSYYGNLKNIPESIVRISIAGKCPDWYQGLEYKRLAPKYNFFQIWKKTHDNDYYIRHFNNEVLDKLNPIDVYNHLKLITHDQDCGIIML